MKQRIVKKLVSMGSIIIICVSSFLLSTILINQKGIMDGFVVNIAGRERMLSQKISKEVFLLNSQDKVDFEELDRAVNEFQKGLDILIHGDKGHSSKPNDDEQIIRQLETINQKWLIFRQNVMVFRGAMMALNDNKAFLDDNNRQMLALSDNVVKSMVGHGLSGQDVDDSGRQRMLTQSMAYHLMRYTNKWDTQSYKDFDDSYNLYNETILRFHIDNKYKAYPKLYEEIEKNYQFWLEYSRHANGVLANQRTVVDSLNKITINNSELLEQIESVVNMYEVDSTGTRTILFYVQLVAAIILFLLGLYSVIILVRIKVTFDEFIYKSKELLNAQKSLGLDKDKFNEIITVTGENELSEISKNISQFIENMGVFEHSSNRVMELSDNITNEITKITSDVVKSLETLDISDEEKQKIISEINLSEDIAIQTSEELIVTSKLLNRLKKSLDVIAKYYSITQNIKK
ncbi:MAG: type IV pili methyl-accepting chemotaxis transducer N-terminal domain-containing protein [Campylobacteraceae bacterium]|nr:type IV pili methyl-accepting chemotaxis transducer N-terminal domain-containing protein [Campylobacteraceae bacterium]